MRSRLALLPLALVFGLAADTPLVDAVAQEAADVRLVDAFPGVDFQRPVFATLAPDGTDRMFVVEQGGRILLLPLPAPVEDATATTFLDIAARVSRSGNERGLLGLAFHPDYAENGRFYVHYSRRSDGAGVLAEYQVGATPDVADVGSERVVLVVPQPYANHNGGMLDFGPDGYLYMGLGDGGSAGDPDETGQDLGSLLGSLLRIDVDGRDTGLEYAVPADNPFVSRGGARGEIWAYGLRNPWRFSFDRQTGELWVADVGQNKWEEIDLIERGGNYGWDRREGLADFEPEAGAPDDPFVDPLHVYDHAQGVSVTGGYVYRGSRIRDLQGAYLFADYISGRLWSLTRDGGVDVQLILETGHNVASFGEDRDGELYLCVFSDGGRVLKLEPGVPPPPPDGLPQRLSETNLFSDLRGRVPVKGALRYSVGSPLWSDRAGKERFVLLPPGTSMEYVGYDAFEMPQNSWAVKTFTLKSQGAVRPLETRVYLRSGEGFVFGTYKWNEEGDEAFLLDGGLTETVIGPKGPQEWTYPSLIDCAKCHQKVANTLLGLTARQVRTPGGGRSIVRRWVRDGVLTGDVPPRREIRRNLPLGGGGKLPRRVRSYLDANCSFCHRPGTPRPVGLDLLARTPLDQTGLLREPVHGSLDIEDALVLARGEPNRSVILSRMGIRDGGVVQMPRVGTDEVHEKALKLMRRWIRKLR